MASPLAALSLTDPPTLLAIARAARKSGDRALERAARQLLREEHGIEINFLRPSPLRILTPAEEEGAADA